MTDGDVEQVVEAVHAALAAPSKLVEPLPAKGELAFATVMGAQTEIEDAKRAAVEQWTADPCGSNAAEGEPGSRSYFEDLLRARFEYGPWMPESLGYDETKGLRVLDVGCGQGIDVYRYALAGARATGIDLTPRHVELSRAHLEAMGLEAEIVQGDAEALPFPDASFDRVSSNGVLHHTPDMPAALREIRRVLAPERRGPRHRLQPKLLPLLAQAGALRGRAPRRPRQGTLDGRRPLARRRVLEHRRTAARARLLAGAGSGVDDGGGVRGRDDGSPALPAERHAVHAGAASLG